VPAIFRPGEIPVCIVNLKEENLQQQKTLSIEVNADPDGRAVQGVGLPPLACWDCGFNSRWVMDLL
jgi:hypothetical protein